MKTQEDYIQEIIAHKTLHPEAQIKLLVDSDGMSEQPWTSHQITRVDVCVWWVKDGQIFLDTVEIEDKLWLDYEDTMPEDELLELIDRTLKNELTLAICVFTEAG